MAERQTVNLYSKFWAEAAESACPSSRARLKRSIYHLYIKPEFLRTDAWSSRSGRRDNILKMAKVRWKKKIWSDTAH